MRLKDGMMRTITKTVNIYTYSELSESSRERVRQRFAEWDGYVWSDDAFASIKALAAHFNTKVADWSVDWFDSSYSRMRFETPYDELTRDEIGGLLAELGTYDPDTLKGHGECKLTGYGTDEDAIDGFRIAFMGGESDLNKLLQAAFRSWLAACQADCADYYSDERFAELCDINEWEFNESGDIIKGDK